MKPVHAVQCIPERLSNACRTDPEWQQTDMPIVLGEGSHLPRRFTINNKIFKDSIEPKQPVSPFTASAETREHQGSASQLSSQYLIKNLFLKITATIQSSVRRKRRKVRVESEKEKL